VAPLPFNFQLGADVTKIVLRPPTTDQGELEVRLDSCAGPLLASAPLERASLTSGPTTLTIAIPPVAGRHDLCLSFTGKRLEPMWAVGLVQLKAGVLAMAPNTGATP
jgi:hexosaminidase